MNDRVESVSDDQKEAAPDSMVEREFFPMKTDEMTRMGVEPMTYGLKGQRSNSSEFGLHSASSVALGHTGESETVGLEGSEGPDVSNPCRDDDAGGEDAEPPSRRRQAYITPAPRSAFALAELAVAAARATSVAESPAPASSRFDLCLLGDEGLTTPAMVVEKLIDLEPGLIPALVEHMNRLHGLGMAAQQVGGRQRVCVVRLAGRSAARVLINPRIVGHAAHTVLCTQEGCLSVPGFRTSTHRYQWINLEWENEKFETQRARVEGLDAQVVQHEIDHLNGKCIADCLSRQQRRRAEKLVEKARGRA